jgi:putative Mg2+ transporter-C (MgtC) family protein
MPWTREQNKRAVFPDFPPFLISPFLQEKRGLSPIKQGERMEAWWQQIADAVAAEFSDLPGLSDATTIALRLVIAAALGGLLGYEREQRGKAAGLRTHMLVALGAALFVLVPQQSGMSHADMSRVIQGVITGMGFLGAGAILKMTNEETIKGLTTAAGLWVTAAIGIAVGLGREASAVLSTLLVVIILHLVPRLLGGHGRD